MWHVILSPSGRLSVLFGQLSLPLCLPPSVWLHPSPPFVFPLKTPIALWPCIDFIGQWSAANPAVNEIMANHTKCTWQERKWFSTSRESTRGHRQTTELVEEHVNLYSICMCVRMIAPSSCSVHAQHWGGVPLLPQLPASPHQLLPLRTFLCSGWVCLCVPLWACGRASRSKPERGVTQGLSYIIIWL